MPRGPTEASTLYVDRRSFPVSRRVAGRDQSN